MAIHHGPADDFKGKTQQILCFSERASLCGCLSGLSCCSTDNIALPTWEYEMVYMVTLLFFLYSFFFGGGGLKDIFVLITQKIVYADTSRGQPPQKKDYVVAHYRGPRARYRGPR